MVVGGGVTWANAAVGTSKMLKRIQIEKRHMAHLQHEIELQRIGAGTNSVLGGESTS
jgi:hypothetical protein